MSQRPQNATFFFQLADLGSTLSYPQLRDGARNLLQLVPPDTHTVSRLQWLFGHHKEYESVENSHSNDEETSVESMFFSPKPSQVLYNLEVQCCFLLNNSK